MKRSPSSPSTPWAWHTTGMSRNFNLLKAGRALACGGEAAALWRRVESQPSKEQKQRSRKQVPVYLYTVGRLRLLFAQNFIFVQSFLLGIFQCDMKSGYHCS